MNKDFIWVQQCITSSFTKFHIEGCYTLLHLYKQKYPELTNDHETLLNEIQDKETSISVDV